MVNGVLDVSGGERRPLSIFTVAPRSADSRTDESATTSGITKPSVTETHDAGKPLVSGRSAFDVFLLRRRTEHAANGVTAPLMALHREWRSLGASDRAVFEAESTRSSQLGSGPRARLAPTSLVASFCTKRDRRSPSPPTREKRGKTRKSKHMKHLKAEDILEVPTAKFPRRPDVSGDRRTAIAGVVRAHSQRNVEQLSALPSGHDDLTALTSRITAPRFSCDWQQDAGDESDESAEGLDVQAPRREGGAREFLRQELQQGISSERVHKLLRQKSDS